MNARLFLAGAIAGCLVVGRARAGDTMLHVTTDGNGATLLVKETPIRRIEICKLPCDVRVDVDGEYRFVGAPGSHVRESQLFTLPNVPSLDLDVSTRSQIRYVEGLILLGVGGASVIAGIVMMVVAHDMNQQTPNSGDVYEGVGSAAGIVGGLLTIAWGAGEVARNGNTRFSVGSTSRSQPSATPPTPPPQSFAPREAPAASMPPLPTRGLALQLLSIRF